jgi:hypothetical protein
MPDVARAIFIKHPKELINQHFVLAQAYLLHETSELLSVKIRILSITVITFIIKLIPISKLL